MNHHIARQVAPVALTFAVLSGSVLGAVSALATTSSTKGTVKSDSATALVVTSGKVTWNFVITSKTKVTLNGKTSKIADVKAKDAVTVDYTVSAKKDDATTVSAS